MSSATSTTPSTFTSRWRPRGEPILRNRRDAAAAALIAAGTLVFWGRFFGGGLVFYARDLGFFFAPLRSAFAQAIRAGASPFWNPSIGAGIPMAADPNNAVFFPATLLFLLRPFSTAARASHLVWAFALPLFSFAALRRLGLSRFSGAVCALAVAWSGPSMTLASLPTTAWAAALFLPLLAAAVSEAALPARAGAVAIFAGLVVLSGEPAIAGEALLLAAIFVVAERRSGAAAFAAGAGLGIAIAAPQIVAAAQLLGGTVRGAGLAAASGAAFYSVRPARIAAFLWPGIFGDVHAASAAGFWGAAFFDAGAPYVSTLAIGTATVALLPAALRDRRGRIFLGLAAVSAVLSFGRYLPGFGRILALPGFSLVRYPEKWLIFSAITAIAAAGLAIDRIRAGDRRAARAASGGAAAIAGLSWAAWTWASVAPQGAWSRLVAWRIVAPAFTRDTGPILASIRGELALTGAFAAAMVLCALGLRSRRLASALAVLLFLDLFPRTWNSVPLEDRGYYDSPPAAASAVAGTGGRFYFDGETEVAADPLRPLRPAMWGVTYAGNNDIDRFSPRRSFLFGRALASIPFSDSRKTALLRLADVKAVSTIDPSAAAVAESLFATSPRRAVLAIAGGSRFRLPAEVLRASGEEEARRAIVDSRFDAARTVVVEGSGPAAADAPREAAISPLRRRADRERIRIDSPGGVLLRSETYDPHWRARIDGRRAPVLPADFAFQAVAVPAGTHEVEFSYDDVATEAAMAVSLAALMVSAILLARR